MELFSDNKKGYLKSSIAIYAFIFVLYLLTAKGIDVSDISVRSRQYLVAGIVAFIIQYIQKKNIFSYPIHVKFLIGYTGILWGVLLPIVKRLTDHTPQINTCYEILFGVYLFLLFIVISNFINKQWKRYAWAIISFVIAIPPIADIVNLCIYGKFIDETSFLAMAQSQLSSWGEWIITYLGLPSLVVILLAVLAYSFLAVRLLHSANGITLLGKSRKILMLISCLLLVYSCSLAGKTWEFSAWRNAQNYVNEQKKFSVEHATTYENLQFDNTDMVLPKKLPGTVILVIGESASRDHMKAYVPDYPYDDTPWLSAKQNEPDFIKFSNVYSCYNQTAVALSYVLTEKSQYNQKQFSDSSTIIDVAKKAGYKTYWLTRQELLSSDNTPMGLISKTADVSQYVELPNGQATYDKDLLPVLEQVADKNASNFIVLHLKGSHPKYQFRYPKDATVFPADDPEGNYANTILYTDEFLQEVFDYAKANLNLQMMIYVSDHGENIYKGHNPQLTTFDQVRIPMFVYLSPEYQQTFPIQTNMLKSRKDAYFTNDMLYNMISGMLNAQSNDYDAHEDFSSTDYSFTRDNLLTFRGKRHISEDNGDN